MNIIQDDVKPDVANAEEEEDMGNESEAASCKSVGKPFTQNLVTAIQDFHGI